MLELVFHIGPMDYGESTLALQPDHTQSTHGRQGRIFTSRDHSDKARTFSRLDFKTPVTEMDEEFDLQTHVIAQLAAGRRINYLVCDETQFYTGEQVEQLARVVDELQIDVYTFGILTDFRTKLLPGSQRLVKLADRVETLPIGLLCWCGAKDTRNARAVNGLAVMEGSQVVVGDIGTGEVRCEVLCRTHHRQRMTATWARATLGEDPLPFGE